MKIGNEEHKFEILKDQFVQYAVHLVLMHRRRFPFSTTFRSGCNDWFMMSFTRDPSIVKDCSACLGDPTERTGSQSAYLVVLFGEKPLEIWSMDLGVASRDRVRQFNSGVLSAYMECVRLFDNLMNLVKSLPAHSRFDAPEVSFRILPSVSKRFGSIVRGRRKAEYRHMTFADISTAHGGIRLGVWYLRKPHVDALNRMRSSMDEHFLVREEIDDGEFELIEDIDADEILSPGTLLKPGDVFQTGVTNSDLRESRLFSDRRYRANEDAIVVFNAYFKKARKTRLEGLDDVVSGDGGKMVHFKSTSLADILSSVDDLNLQ